MKPSKPTDKPTKAAPKRGLGRGLSALIPTAPAPVAFSSAAQPAARSAGLQAISLTKIALNPYQPRGRFAPEHMEELTASIRQHGVLQPIVVRPKGRGYELVAGERRFRAATSAGLLEIPAVVRDLTDEQSLALALIENLQREDLNPVEAGRAYRRLIDEFGLTQMELADEVGKSQSSVANALRLLSLPLPILTSIEEGVLSEGHAKAILTVEREDQRLSLWREVLDRRLSVREAEQHAGRIKRSKIIPRGIISPASSERQSLTINLRAVERAISSHLGTAVRLRYSKASHGRIEIDFYDQEQLEGLIRQLLGGQATG